jgi:hypothetical protein
MKITMHTSFEFGSGDFALTRRGEPVGRDVLLDWDVRDRVGVLIDRPVGALGAGLLILLAITAFYDCPERKRRRTPIYPDIFLFHVGGRWGLFSMFDFWPDHKEVFVKADPREVLRAVNNRGITHLILPERERQVVVHRYKEPEAAADRLKKCFAYSPDGSVSDGDIVIETRAKSIFKNYAAVLDMEAYLEAVDRQEGSGRPARVLAASSAEELIFSIQYARSRLGEVRKDDPCRMSASARLADAERAGVLAETFREIGVDEALHMLSGAPVSGRDL